MSAQTDTKMDIAIGHLLRIGVSVAAAVVLTGWVLYLAQAHGTAPDYRHFHGRPLQLLQLGPILKGAGRLDSRSVIELGILLLIVTPVARVIFCIGGFAAQRDRLYVLVSSLVLAILMYSLFLRS
jgi:uncharacterized membrane protein